MSVVHNLVSQQAIVTGAGRTMVKKDQVLVSGFIMVPLYFGHIELLIECREKEVAVIVNPLFQQQTFHIGLFLLIILHAAQVIKLPVGQSSGNVD